MAKYFLTNKAVSDLTNIWNYTLDQWSGEQADKYYLEIISRCEYIAQIPKIGKNYEGITQDLFGLNSGRHIIFYRVISTNKIEITRILHQQMDLKRRILE
ncbi:MAG: type II toxin-antitoxin system RelE/ParE family toxin [Cytophagales bacterium]